jgi:hypothetical protein
MLADAGPSITITSLTNFLSFAIGIGTPTPAIRVFCIYITVAVFFDYIYQVSWVMVTEIWLMFRYFSTPLLLQLAECGKTPV